MNTIDSIDAVQNALQENSYIADRSLATAVFLALRRNRPLLLEGEAGVGKTEIAKVLANILDTELIRLQCYEGIDVNTAVYEWNYTRQMLHIRLYEASGATSDSELKEIFSPEFLIKRPLLQSIDASYERAPVLLIDEIDRADEEFEAFLLELLSDFQITIPEIGTIHAIHLPVVVITSNRTRELHDALRRRCFYYWVEYPTLEKEIQIVRVKVPGAGEQLTRQICVFMQQLRKVDLFKLPGVAETLDWASALVDMGQTELREALVNDTLGCILKYQDDVLKIRGKSASQLIQEAKSGQ